MMSPLPGLGVLRMRYPWGSADLTPGYLMPPSGLRSRLPYVGFRIPTGKTGTALPRRFRFREGRLDLDRLHLQDFGYHAAILVATSAGTLRIPGDDLEHFQIPPGSAHGVFDEPGLVDQARFVHLFRFLEELVEDRPSTFEQVETLFNGLTPEASHLNFAGMIEVVGTMSIRRICVAFPRIDGVSGQHKMLCPDFVTRIEQTPPVRRVDVGRCTAIPVAVPAGIEAVRVDVGARFVVAHRNKMFHLRDAESFGPTGGEVSLVAQAEGTGETEFPAQA